MIPQRVVLCVMGFLAVTVTYTMRACLTIAITEMVVPINDTKIEIESSICPTHGTINESSIIRSHTDYAEAMRYNWTQEQQGWILSSYFGGYVISHIPGSMLAEKFGGKWTMALSILFSAICNAVTPQALEYGGYSALIVLRTLLGLFTGVLFPTLTVLLAAWVPEGERAKLGSLAFSGGQPGNVLSLYISGLILSYQPWPMVFYFWSVVAVIWFIAFILLCSSDPASHPYITEEERDYLVSQMGQLRRHDNLPPTPWKDILTSVPIIVLIISQVGNDCLWVVLAVDLPKYMKEILGFSVHDVGLYSSLPYLLLWIVSILSGWLCDYLIDRHYLTTVQARKLFTALSGIFPAVFALAATYAGCNRILVVILFILALGFLGNYYPGMRVNALDLSPNYAASIISIVNGSGAIVAFIFPAFVGKIISDSTIEQWRTVFVITFGIAIVRVAIYSIWASAEVQPWNNPTRCELTESEKLSNDTENPSTRRDTLD